MVGNFSYRPKYRRNLLCLAIVGVAAIVFSACNTSASRGSGLEQVRVAATFPPAQATLIPFPTETPTPTATSTPISPPTMTPTPLPTLTPTPEPFVIPAGQQRIPLMEGTRFETPLYVIGSGLPGQVLMILGGVHGDEPGGWLAAERLLESMRPSTGAVLIIPRANRLADSAQVRTRPEWGDLNRLYPGSPDGPPMAQMAWQIIETLREYHVNVVLDMHESWVFFNGRAYNGTAYLGQTVGTSPDDQAQMLARNVVAAVNTRIRHPREEFFDRNNPDNPPPQFSGPPPVPNAGQNVPGGTSSLGLGRFVPDLSTLLVEMGQQQDLERRIALHVEIANELARELGIAD